MIFYSPPYQKRFLSVKGMLVDFDGSSLEKIFEWLLSRDKKIEGYENEDGEELSKNDIADLLFDMDEDDFYEKLEELKEYINYDNDIKLYNIADDDELDFLEED
jgi:hypothetical protein